MSEKTKLAQECADYATSLRSAANVCRLEGRAAPVSFLRAADLMERAAVALASQLMHDKRDYDEAIEAVRICFCKLPRYSFLISAGGVRRAENKSGNWVEWDQVHALFELVVVDAALASAQAGKAISDARGNS